MKYCARCGASVTRKIPPDDNRERWVCESCGGVHYQNPLVVVGCVPARDDKILLCKRAIEPRRGYWTVPAGFMELGETMPEGAARETMEEACAKVRIGHAFACVDVVSAGQVHVFFTAELLSDFKPGPESLEVELFRQADIPWDDIAFRSGLFALEKYYEDRGNNNGIHLHAIHRHRD